MYRNEAAGLPTTVRGPEPNNPRGLYNTGLGDMRGYYSDGAYVAAPITAPAPIIGPVMPRGLDSTEEDELVDDEAVNDFVDSEGPVKWYETPNPELFKHAKFFELGSTRKSRIKAVFCFALKASANFWLSRLPKPR